MPMEIYADESGIHAGSKRCVVAGLCGGRNKFNNLEWEWERLLKKSGIALEIGFHAKQLFRKTQDGERVGPYRGWSDARVFDFLSLAVGLIHSNSLRAVGGGIDINYFNSLPHNLRRWLTGGSYNEHTDKWTSSGAPSKPYFFAFHEVILASVQFAKHDSVVIDGIFDQQQNFVDSPWTCGLRSRDTRV